MKLLTFILLLNFLSVSVLSQRDILVSVSNPNSEPIPDAHIIVYKADSSGILGFSFTDTKGSARINLPESSDSILLTISHISYEQKLMLVSTLDQGINVELNPREEPLPEVTISPEPFYRKGDTLVFDAEKYSRGNDENIEDILRHVPGISIEDNGTILYKGLEISKFYIEGMDMLEGRYAIATRQLNKEVVRDIEILEYHQSKKALKDIIVPQEAAINLRLKKGVKLTGKAEAGLGATPFMRLLATDLFGFGKKQQFYVTASINNFGIQRTSNFTNLYKKPLNIQLELVSVNQINRPFNLVKSSYLDNNEYIAGFNYLRKVTDDFQFKWQATYIQDHLNFQGQKRFQLDNEGAPIVQDFNLKNSLNNKTLNQNIIFELNKDKLFFRADNNLIFDRNNNAGNHIFNNKDSPEFLTDSNFSAETSIESIFKKRSKAYTIYTDLSFINNRDSLTLRNTALTLPGVYFFEDTDAVQITREQDFNLNSYTYFVQNKGLKTRYLKLGFHLENNRLNTDLRFVEAIQSMIEEHIFQNNNQFRSWAPNAALHYKIEREKDNWQFNLPVRWFNYTASDFIRNDDAIGSLLLFDANAQYTGQLGKHYNFQSSLLYKYDFEQFNTRFYEGFIFSSGRNIRSNVLDLNTFRQQKLELSLHRVLLQSNTYIRLNTVLNRYEFDQLSVNNFLEEATVSEQRIFTNIRRRLDASLEISGQLFSVLDYSVDLDFTYSQIPSVINKQLENVTADRRKASLELSYLWNNWIFSVNPAYIAQKNQLLGEKAQRVQIENKLFYSLDKWGIFRVQFDVYRITGIEIDQWNRLLTCKYEKHLKKQNLDFSLAIINITNEKVFVDYEQNLFFSQKNTVLLRSILAQLTLKKRI